jgi:hypothetical protein
MEMKTGVRRMASYQDQDFEAVIDLQEVQDISSISNFFYKILALGF